MKSSMAIKWSLVVILALCLGQAIGAGENEVNAPELPSSDKTNKITTPKPDFPDDNKNSTTTTTTEPTSTTTTTSTTPETPSTSTTTEKPTTTTETPSTSTTTAKPSTTTVKPDHPEWPYNIGNWNYTEEHSNVSCIKIRAAFQLYFPYNVTVNKTEHKEKEEMGTVNVPIDATVTGACGTKIQTITLHWPSENEHKENNLTLNFAIEGNVTDGKFGLGSVEFTVILTNETFPNATSNNVTYEIVHLAKDQVPIHKSYKCLAKRSVKNEKEKQELKIASSQFEAFRTSATDNFSPSEECSLDGVTDIVPIAVGASLAGLVVVVLIAYLIGRRRSRARGYQSV